MSIDDYFEKFYTNIKLTSDQRDDAISKYTGVSKALHNHYYPTIEYSGNTKLLIGSYGKHTNIRPPRDVDILFIMPPEKFEQYSDNTSNSQAQLLQDIKKILSNKYKTTEKMRAWGKVVLVEFSDGTHNVEVLPAWEKEDNTFIIPNSENGGSWENWDPRAEIENIQEFDKDNGITKKLIRMIKKWSETCSVHVKTYKIETTILDFFFQKFHENKSYPSVVKDFFEFFYNNETDEYIKSHLKTAHNRASKACTFEDEGKLSEAIEEWKKVFGSDFPQVETEKAIVKSFHQIISQLQSLFPTTTEEYLDRKYGIATVLNPTYSIIVDVNINQNGWRKNYWLLSEFQKRGYRIQTKANLLFKIISHNVPEPYSVKWKVRNFGNEARDADALRGEITDDDGSETKKESTLYYGEHYVECYIIKNGQCVATGQVFVPIG